MGTPARQTTRASPYLCRNPPLREISPGPPSSSPPADTYRFGPTTTAATGSSGIEGQTRRANTRGKHQGQTLMSDSANIRSRNAGRGARLGESGMGLLELIIAMTVLTIGMPVSYTHL